MSAWGEYDHCFGCGQSHPFGLRMQFRQIDDRTVESLWTAHDTHGGAPGIVHGGLQATMLDEAAGYACHTQDLGAESNLVTVEFSLRYRRPVSTATPLRIVGRVVEVDGPNLHTECHIELPDGTHATLATARWKRLD